MLDFCPHSIIPVTLNSEYPTGTIIGKSGFRAVSDNVYNGVYTISTGGKHT